MKRDISCYILVTIWGCLISGPYGAPTVKPDFNASCVTLEISDPDEPNGIIRQYSVSYSCLT